MCNWALAYDDPEGLCRSCRLTKTIPNLSKPGNDQLWYRMESAKRRLVYTLDQLGLPQDGLSFELLEDAPDGTKVMTGHAGGVITINLAEADDAERVKRRLALNEPYRTVLGHFRHESGHFYWDQLVKDSPRLARFREVFGDEQADYQAAVKRHYDQGAPAGWQNDFVSAYATMHPWEDWAETWAHYLHMLDTLETAAATGISIQPPRNDEPAMSQVVDPIQESDVPFGKMMDAWGTITYVLNNLNRGLGNEDAYPFVLSPASTAKIRFVHDTILAHVRKNAAQAA